MKRFALAVLLSSALFTAKVDAQDMPTQEELAAFFDRTVPELMEKHNVVGAVAGVTDGSETLFLGGYGEADLEEGIPVDPQTTLFRAGSI
jgi:CubicO group peptidase (beta-lactamase class C family)